jgi:hypothetical protein
MKPFGFVWLAIAFAAVFLIGGIPYWRIPYNQFDASHIEVLPGVVLLGFLTFMLVFDAAVPARTVVVTMLLCGPAIVGVSILRDTAADPTSHNLWPFEIVFAAILGGAIVVTGWAVGRAARWIAAR